MVISAYYCVFFFKYRNLYLNFSGKSGVWDYDSLDFYLGRLRFINKRIPSVFLYGIFDFPAWQVKNNLCPIEFTKFVVVESPYAGEYSLYKSGIFIFQ